MIREKSVGVRKEGGKSEGISMSYDIIVSFMVLLLAIILFSTEKIRTDIVAIIIMVILPWTKVITPEEAFSGFSSNAVITVIAVMILGYGIESSGALNFLATFISGRAGTKSRTVMAYIAGATGLISSFLQNIGAVALFLPVAKKISESANVNLRKIIMPMGFVGIMGGTLTMIASSPLIILNDLLLEGGLTPLNFFSVTPVGLALFAAGIIYFFFAGDALFTDDKEENGKTDNILSIYDLPKKVYEIEIKEGSPLVGKTIEEIELWAMNKIHILAIWDSGSTTYTPWRKSRLNARQRIAVFGRFEYIEEFHTSFDLDLKTILYVFHELSNEKVAGFAEIIIPPKSSVVGKTLKEVSIRKNFKIEPITYISPEGDRLRVLERPLEAGLQIIVFGRWEAIKRIKESKDFVVITDVKPIQKEHNKIKSNISLLALGLSVFLVMFGLSLPLSFLTGAIIMLLFGVIPKEDLYKAVDWKTVFLLAGLLPLGIAFEKSGAAELSAEVIIGITHAWPDFTILLVIALITAVFSLFMSNAAATVLLVPIVLVMSSSFGMDPKGLALLVAVSASNSFILPTHQVNAYIKGPGKYTNKDFIRVGGLMSLIFLFVSVTMIYIFYV